MARAPRAAGRWRGSLSPAAARGRRGCRSPRVGARRGLRAPGDRLRTARPRAAFHAADRPVSARLGTMRRVLALWEKEWLVLARDVHGLAVLFLMPAVFIVVMSLALSDAFKEDGA